MNWYSISYLNGKVKSIRIISLGYSIVPQLQHKYLYANNIKNNNSHFSRNNITIPVWNSNRKWTFSSFRWFNLTFFLQISIFQKSLLTECHFIWLISFVQTYYEALLKWTEWNGIVSAEIHSPRKNRSSEYKVEWSGNGIHLRTLWNLVTNIFFWSAISNHDCNQVIQ